MSRIEVLSGPERRRRWSAEEKRSIVAEAFAPGGSVCAVAGRRDVVPGQIYRWRNELRDTAPGFTAVVVTPRAERAIDGVRAGGGDRTRPGHSGSDCSDGAQGAGVGDHQGSGGAMIPFSTGVRVWIAAGHTDMRR